MRDYSIPFNRSYLAGDEFRYMREAVERGRTSGDGEFTRRCNEMLEREIVGGKALLTTSCTHALEMAAMLLDLKPGDEVLVPSFTFVSTVNAFVLRGAKPVFVDIRPDTLNLDEGLLEAAVGPAAKAIFAVNYAGVGCEYDRLRETADRRSLKIVEDNAHGLFGKYRGKPLGGFGDIAALSFHETKNFSCGEGGAILLNDPVHVERAEILREKGTDRSRFFRGQVDKYSWVDIGSSYLPSEILAAFLCAQLERREEIQDKRRSISEFYRKNLGEWAGAHGVGLPQVPGHCESSHHMFYLLFPEAAQRDGLMRHLQARGIMALFHYVPLHLSKMGRRFGGREGQCPVTERTAARLLRLPFFTGLSEAELSRVVDAVLEFKP